MTEVKKELQKLQDKARKKYEVGYASLAKGKKALEEAKSLTFKAERVRELLTA